MVLEIQWAVVVELRHLVPFFSARQQSSSPLKVDFVHARGFWARSTPFALQVKPPVEEDASAKLAPEAQAPGLPAPQGFL